MGGKSCFKQHLRFSNRNIIQQNYVNSSGLSCISVESTMETSVSVCKRPSSKAETNKCAHEHSVRGLRRQIILMNGCK